MRTDGSTSSGGRDNCYVTVFAGETAEQRGAGVFCGAQERTLKVIRCERPSIKTAA